MAIALKRDWSRLHDLIDEIKRPEAPSIERGFDWRPQEGPQTEFLDACGYLDALLDNDASRIKPPVTSYIGYGGAAGGGKTDSLLAVMCIACYLQPGITCVFFRRKLKDNKGAGTAWARLKRILDLCSQVTANESNMTMRWHNGSLIQLRGCENVRDVQDYQGWQIGIVGFDEATHFTWTIVDFILSRNRDADHKYVYPFAAFATNPGGIGSIWYKPMFIESGEQCEVHAVLNPNKRPVNTYFIQAYVWDNKLLLENDKTYIDKLNALDDVSRARFLDGEWGISTGNFFGWRTGDQADKPGHEIEPFAVPSEWPLYTSIDYGFAVSQNKPDEKKFVAGLYAIDYAGHAYRIDERYGSLLDIDEQVRLICEMEYTQVTGEPWPSDSSDPAVQDNLRAVARRVRYRIGCPKMFQKEQTASPTIAELYGKTFAKLTGGKESRQPLCERGTEWHRYAVCRQWLGMAPDGRPWFQSFKSCTHFNKQVLQAVPDEFKQEGIDPRFADHAIEEWGHFLMSRPKPGQLKAEEPQLYSLDWFDKKVFKNTARVRARAGGR